MAALRRLVPPDEDAQHRSDVREAGRTMLLCCFEKAAGREPRQQNDGGSDLEGWHDRMHLRVGMKQRREHQDAVVLGEIE